MRRRVFLAVSTLLLLESIAVLAGAGTSGRLDAAAIRAALRTSTAEENGFVDRVVGLVNNGTLPRSLVESTLLWARTKPRHRFQYFKRALIERAARQGITI
jgi:hypothetical protein